MQAKLDTTTKTLTVTYEDDIQLLAIWAYLNINRADMLKSANEARLTTENEAALTTESLKFYGSAYPLWDALDEHLIAANIIVRA